MVKENGALILQVYNFSICHHSGASTRMLKGYLCTIGTELIQITCLVTPQLVMEGEMLGSVSNIFCLIRVNFVCG